MLKFLKKNSNPSIDKIFKFYGGLLSQEKIQRLYGSQKDLFYVGRTLADCFIKDNNKWGDVHFDYIDTPELNAVAIKLKRNRYCIGLFRECIPTLYTHFSNLFKNHEIISNLTNNSPITKTRCESLHENIFIKDLKKINADFLTLIAICFYIYHEVAHIIRGHIDFKEKTENKKQIIEYTVDKRLYIKSLQNMAIECDADLYGGIGSLLYIPIIINTYKVILTNFDIKRFDNSRMPFEEDSSMFYIWSFTISIFFRIIHHHFKLLSENVISSHPPPILRGDLLISRVKMFNFDKSTSKKKGGEIISALDLGMKHGKKAWSLMGFTEVSHDIKDVKNVIAAMSILNNDLDVIFSKSTPGGLIYQGEKLVV